MVTLVQQSEREHWIRTGFFTGLVILLPLALTVGIVGFLTDLLTNPFVGMAESALETLGIGNSGILFLTPKQTLRYGSQFIILLLLFFATVSLGFIGQWFLIHTVIGLGEKIVQRIPFIRSVYKTSQEVIHTLFAAKTKSFKQVALVPFFPGDTLAIGLVTAEGIKKANDKKYQDLISVFVPTTPNPTSGFLVMFEQKDVIYLDMKVEEALKHIISCGVIPTPFVKKEG